MAQEINGIDKSELRIYDPFYCEGRVKENLAKFGFTNVINPCKDFYSSPLPEFDVIVSNPPYSGNHIEKFLKFCVNSHKPWFLLLPNFVLLKPYYTYSIIPVGKVKAVPQRVFFVIPEHRYEFLTPKGRHQKKSKDYTSPHFTFWYCHFYGGETLADAFKWIKRQPKDPSYYICKILTELPLRVLDRNDPKSKKAKNAKKKKPLKDPYID